MRQLILITGSFLILSVLALKFYFQLAPLPPSTLETPISELIPKEIDGWTSNDYDLASSPESSERISDFLNLDDSLFRVFKHGATQVSVYVAYWTPGKVSYRWAGAHTPDTCWVVNGWKRLDRQYCIPFNASNIQFKNAEFGIYEKDLDIQNVYFWHLVGGEPFGYEQKEIPNIFASLIDIKKYGLNLRQEQFFIRLSSNETIDTLSEIDGFDQIVQGLSKLNLSLDSAE
jgi:hypothetical protein